MRNVLAVLLATNTSFGRTEAEVLSAGRRLCDDLGCELGAAILGASQDVWTKEAQAYGAERVYRVEHPALGTYQADLFSAALQQVYAVAQAEVVLFPSTSYGLEVAPLFGYKIAGSVTLDCVELRGDKQTGQVRIVKPVYGGKAHWIQIAKKAPIVVALRMRSVELLDRESGRQAEVFGLDVQLDPQAALSRIVERKVEEAVGLRVEDARMVVSGGRGIGGRENFALLGDLARMLGGAVGASRVPCDLGWVPASWQIGQTGKKVAPDLYVAVGISGASQHMVGVTGAKHIVAINKDPNAPICRAAEFAVVEDYRTFIPTLIEALKQHKAT